MTPGLLTRLLDFLDSPRARRYWSGWKGVRNLNAYTIWWFRFHGRYRVSGYPFDR